MNTEQLWQQALGEIELQISRPNFMTWFKNSRLVEKDGGGKALVALSNNFAKEWVENKYHKLIADILFSFDNSIKRVEYTVVSLPPGPEPILAAIEKRRCSSQPEFPELKVDPESSLHPKYTFKSFVVGSSNELAFAAAQAIIKDIGTKYNPLFIYGGTGLGKTHLLQALGNEIKSAYKNKIKVRYVPSEKFVNDIVSAIRNKRTDDIKEKYRTVDVLIVDDIQFIAGKERSEEEFFHTFNALHENNKQIIISSDRPPAATPVLEERLKSRFSGGMIADITYPDYEMRVAIIKTKLKDKNALLDDSLCELVASKIQRNIRELEGVLNKIVFHQESKGTGPDAAVINEIIDKTIKQGFKNLSPGKIIRAVSSFFEISEKDIGGSSRRKELVEPRQIAMFLLKELLGMSYSDIGHKLGKRDHSTVIHAYEKISSQMNLDQKLNQKIILIKEIVEKE